MKRGGTLNFLGSYRRLERKARAVVDFVYVPCYRLDLARMWIWILAIAVIFLIAVFCYHSILSIVLEDDHSFLILTAFLLAAFFVIGFLLIRVIPEPGRANVSDLQSVGKATVENYLNNKR